jgi:hypothetical protein
VSHPDKKCRGIGTADPDCKVVTTPVSTSTTTVQALIVTHTIKVVRVSAMTITVIGLSHSSRLSGLWGF